jgi:NTE family protein
MVDLVLPKTGFISGKRIKDWLGLIIGSDIKFSELRIPFACVATDIMTGEEVIISQGSVLDGIRASISIPGVFTVVKSGGRYLVDGGLVNPVPVSVLKKMGAEFIIAVNASPDIGTSDRAHQMEGEKLKEPNIIGIMMQSMHISTYSLIKASLEDADIVIQPQVAHIGPADFLRAGDCIERGQLAAQDSMPEIKRKLRV